MSERVWVVYKITCLKNGKAYIGITRKTLRERFGAHLWSAKNTRAMTLHKAMAKHGPENFVVEELAQCSSALEAAVCERAQIAQHRSHISGRCGYNTTLGGEGAWGRPITKRQREVMSRIGKRVMNDPAVREKINAGIRASKTVGRYERSQETRELIRSIRTGTTLSAETKAKVGAAGRGRKKTQEELERRAVTWRAKLASGWRMPREAVARGQATRAKNGYRASAETRAKISAGGRGLKRSEQTKARISAASTARLQTEAGKAWIAATIERNRKSGAATSARNRLLWRTNPTYRAIRMKAMKQYKHLSDEMRMTMAIDAITNSAGVTLCDKEYSPNNHDRYNY